MPITWALRPAVSADGSRVYAAPFYSGNRTTVASKEAVATVYADLVAKANLLGRERGFIYESGLYRSDSSLFPPLTPAQLLSLATSDRHAITFTCVPVGTGYRIAIDRDADGVADGDERFGSRWQ